MSSYRELTNALLEMLRAYRKVGGAETSFVDSVETMLKEALRGRVSPTPWTPLERREGFGLQNVSAMVDQAQKAFPGVTEAVVRGLMELQAAEGWEVWANTSYQVMKRDIGDGWVWLSIKRHDRTPVRSWRDLQRIKSELVGAECEGMEIYPAESRLVDTSNQYHLWVNASPEFRFPFDLGDSGRVVVEGTDAQNPIGES